MAQDAGPMFSLNARQFSGEAASGMAKAGAVRLDKDGGVFPVLCLRRNGRNFPEDWGQISHVDERLLITQSFDQFLACD